jgi:hypothetical protein
MSTTEHSPAIYTGTLEQVLDDIIAAKARGDDVQVVRTPAGDYVAVPIQTVQAHGIPSPRLTDENAESRRWLASSRIRHPVMLGLVLLLSLALGVVILVCVGIALMGVVTWVKANAAMVGGVLLAVIFVVAFFTVLIVKARGQRSIHVNNYTSTNTSEA